MDKQLKKDLHHIDMIQKYAKGDEIRNFVQPVYAWCAIVAIFISLFIAMLIFYYFKSAVYAIVTFIVATTLLTYILKNFAVWKPFAYFLGFSSAIVGSGITAYIIIWLLNTLSAGMITIPTAGFYIITAVLTIFKIKKKYWIATGYVECVVYHRKLNGKNTIL